MIGLGLVRPLAVIPQVDEWSTDRLHRTREIAPAGIPVAALATGAALVLGPDGRWRGEGAVEVFVDGRPAGLDALAVSSR
jgi:hypothetical protein